jgi:hypothetical protein
MMLLNAFSLQMVDFPATIVAEEISPPNCDELKNMVSAIGHADTATILGVGMRLINVQLKKGDVAIVAQLIGGRLPEGSTMLPEGFAFKFIKITIN